MTNINHKSEATSSPHTPGPWNVQPEQATQGRNLVVCSGALILATVRPLSPGCELGAADHANARLIAAAPALLDALTSLLTATAGYARHFHEYKVAEAVLAEATNLNAGRAA